MSKFPKLISVEEFIKSFNESLAAPISSNKLYALVRENDFPSVKLGGRYYILEDKITEWLEQQIFKKNEK